MAAPDLVDLHRVQGHHRVASGDEEDAKRIYRLAREILSNLDGLLDRKKVETVASLSSRRSSVGIASVSGQDVIIPTILASVLRQHSMFQSYVSVRCSPLYASSLAVAR